MEDQIMQIDCKKHIKIYLLSQQGIDNKKIAELVKSNAGHVWNVLNDYKTKPEKVELANKLINVE